MNSITGNVDTIHKNYFRMENSHINKMGHVVEKTSLRIIHPLNIIKISYRTFHTNLLDSQPVLFMKNADGYIKQFIIKN